MPVSPRGDSLDGLCEDKISVFIKTDFLPLLLLSIKGEELLKNLVYFSFLRLFYFLFTFLSAWGSENKAQENAAMFGLQTAQGAVISFGKQTSHCFCGISLISSKPLMFDL